MTRHLATLRESGQRILITIMHQQRKQGKDKVILSLGLPYQLACKRGLRGSPLPLCEEQSWTVRAIPFCHTAAILPRLTRRAFFYLARPSLTVETMGVRLSVVKQKLCRLPGQYGSRHVTRTNMIKHFSLPCRRVLIPFADKKMGQQ